MNASTAVPASLQRTLRPAAARWHPPMLAQLADRAPRGDWVYERKLDGYRIIAVCGRRPQLFSRSGQDVTHRFPLVAGLPERECVLDGEAVAMQGGRDSFSEVQQGRATHLVLFDILQLDGRDVRSLPWSQRRPLLDALPLRTPCARLPHATGDGDAMRQRACELGWEGLIAKDPEASYVAGRSRKWLKLKCLRGQEFVVGGFTDPGGARSAFGALLVGYYEDGALRYAGKVGTGFDEATLRRLHAQLKVIERPTAGFADAPRMAAHWVEPELVCQVDFTEWTPDGRLRHPRFLGLRDDKHPSEVVREA